MPSAADALTAHVTLYPAPVVVAGGVVASVPIGDPVMHTALLDALHADERALHDSMPAARRASFVAGRAALRAAMASALHADSAAVGIEVRASAHSPVLQTARGGPHLPVGAAGSVSHKRTRAVALAAPVGPALVHAGIDLEDLQAHVPRESGIVPYAPGAPGLASRILTPREQATLAALPLGAQHEAILLRFSLKEAVYKAIDPVVQRYVRFTEVELEFDHGPNGEALVHLLLPAHERAGMVVRAGWHIDAGWITSVAATSLR